MIAGVAARARAAAAAAATTDDDNDNNDDVPEHLSCHALRETLVCYVCHSLPVGRVDQCANGHFLCAEAGRAWRCLHASREREREMRQRV